MVTRGIMFIGKYENTLDTKNRLIVPSKFREELGIRCVITRGLDNCIYIYPVHEWEDFLLKLSELPISDINARKFVRHFNASANEAEIDSQGRLTIPADLKDYMGAQKEITTIGDRNKLEIWDRKTLNSVSSEALPSPSELAESMKQYGI